MFKLNVSQIRNKYSLCAKIKLFYWLIRTKLICRKARLMRFPLDIRGGRYVDFGKNLTTGVGCRIDAFSPEGKKVLFFGEDVQLNDYVHICAMNKVSIGNRVLMAGRIYISDNSHGKYKGEKDDSPPDVPPAQRDFWVQETVIEDDVWLGEGVVVLPGVRIGKGAVIGANAVVARDIPAYTIAVGSPARVIKQYDFIQNNWKTTK